MADILKNEILDILSNQLKKDAGGALEPSDSSADQSSKNQKKIK